MKQKVDSNTNKCTTSNYDRRRNRASPENEGINKPARPRDLLVHAPLPFRRVQILPKLLSYPGTCDDWLSIRVSDSTSISGLYPLGIAIRYVLDALQCPPETNLFKFGLQALSRFESRLPEWRLVCQALMDIPHLAEARPDIVESVRRALASGTEQSTEQLQGFPSSLSIVEAHHTFRSIHPDDVDDGEFDDPPEGGL